MDFHEVIQGPKILLSYSVLADEERDNFLTSLAGKWHKLFLHSSHCQEFTPVATPKCKGSWEITLCPGGKEMSLSETRRSLCHSPAFRSPVTHFLLPPDSLLSEGDNSMSQLVTTSGSKPRISEWYRIPFVRSRRGFSWFCCPQATSVHCSPPEHSDSTFWEIFLVQYLAWAHTPKMGIEESPLEAVLLPDGMSSGNSRIFK